MYTQTIIYYLNSLAHIIDYSLCWRMKIIISITITYGNVIPIYFLFFFLSNVTSIGIFDDVHVQFGILMGFVAGICRTSVSMLWMNEINLTIGLSYVIFIWLPVDQVYPILLPID